MLELLVGMLIAMFSVMAMLSLFRTTSRVTAESRVGAQQDGQLAAALLAAEQLLSQAGYVNAAASGVLPQPRYPDDLRLLQRATPGGSAEPLLALPASGALIAASGAGQALLWRSRDASGVYHYDGVYAPASGGLWRLQGNSMDWAGWSVAAPLLQPPTPTPAAAPDTGVVRLSLLPVAGGCQPYGLVSQASGGRYVLRLAVAGHAGQQTVNSSICLMNFS